MAEEKKINIDEVASKEFMEKTSLEDLVNLVDTHVAQQGNRQEIIAEALRDTLECCIKKGNMVRAREEIENAIGMYAHCYGGARQKL